MKEEKEVNPFIARFPLKVIKVHEKKYSVSTTKLPKDGIVTDMTEVDERRRIYLMDQKYKTSVFQNTHADRLINSLSHSALKLYMWIIMKLPRYEDTIELNYKHIGKKLKFSSNKTFYNAIEKLEELMIVERKGTNTYWVNAFYIFNGDRIRYYQLNDGQIDIVAEKARNI